MFLKSLFVIICPFALISQTSFNNIYDYETGNRITKCILNESIIYGIGWSNPTNTMLGNELVFFKTNIDGSSALYKNLGELGTCYSKDINLLSDTSLLVTYEETISNTVYTKSVELNFFGEIINQISLPNVPNNHIATTFSSGDFKFFVRTEPDNNTVYTITNQGILSSTLEIFDTLSIKKVSPVNSGYNISGTIEASNIDFVANLDDSFNVNWFKTIETPDIETYNYLLQVEDKIFISGKRNLWQSRDYNKSFVQQINASNGDLISEYLSSHDNHSTVVQIVMDNEFNVFCLGNTFEIDTDENIVQKIYLTKIKNNGIIEWEKIINSDFKETALTLICDNNLNIHVFGTRTTESNLKFIHYNIDSDGEYLNVDPVLFTSSLTKIYPNPSQGIFTVSIPNKKDGFQFQLIDMTGRLVHNHTLDLSSIQLNLSSLQKGTYTAIIKTNQNVAKTKIVIN